MSYKDIEKSRELRLWIGQVIMPAITGCIFLWTNLNARNWIKDKISKIKEKFHKKENNNIIVLNNYEESK